MIPSSTPTPTYSPRLVVVHYSHQVDFLNNAFIGTVSFLGGDTGVVVDNRSPGGLIRQNAFNTTGTMQGVIRSNVSGMVTENNFNSDSLIKVFGTSGPLIINAENNWWGDTDPSNNVVDEVDFTPFASSPFPEYALNQPPVANAGVDQTVLVNSQVTLDGSGSSDPELNQITYLWGEDGGNPQTGILLNSTTVNPSFTPTTAGSYQFILIVNDGLVGSAPDTVVITVQTAPEATTDLVTVVESFNLQQGIDNSLDAKLDAALGALDDLNQNNDVAAINSLQSFINAVEAQRGKSLTDIQADELVNAAQAIIDSLST